MFRAILRAYFIIFFLLPITAQSQDIGINFNFQKVDLEDGLTNNHFNSFIFEDSKGFTWISSIDGLNRFDGTKVKKYGLKSGLKGKNIQSDFFEDKEGNIWFSTYKAINCYLRSFDTIQAFQFKDEWNKAIDEGYKIFHLDYLNNRIWVKAREYIFGFNIYDPKDNFYLPQKTNGVHFSTINDARGQLEKIIACPWWNDSGVDFFHIKDTILVDYQKYLPEYSRISKSIHLKNSLWLFITNKGSLLFDEENPTNLEALSTSTKATFNDILKINEEKILISTGVKGLWCFNWKEKKIVNQWNFNENEKYGIFSNAVRELYLTDKKILWTTARNLGLNYSFLYYNSFENPLERIGLYDVKIVSIREVDDKIWIGTRKHGIIVLSDNGDFVKHYNNNFSSQDSSQIWQIGSNAQKDIFGATSKGLYHINKESIEKISPTINLSFRFISSIYPDRTLISTTSGVKELKRNLDKSYYIEDCSEFLDYPNFSFLQIFQTSRKKVYIPYSANELWTYDATNQGLESVAKLGTDMEFFNFYESKKYAGIIWAGSSNGLMKITKDTIVEPVFDDIATLGERNIYSVIEDNNGVLWITTNQGLWQYFPESGKLFQYEEEDGLTSNFFSYHNSSLLASNGDIWLGTNKGLVKFNPKKIKPYAIPPQVYINELTINDEEQHKGIGEKTELSLTHKQNTLSFDVAAIGYYKAKRNTIAYQLEGYEDEWLSVKNGQPIRFTKISPGQYTLKLKVVDVNGNESDIHHLAIEIVPPFWQTRWFYLLCTLFGIGIVYVIYKNRVAQIKKKEAEKTKLAQLELKAVEHELKALRAQMNPHFLFNTMNSIKGIIIKKEVKNAITYLTKLSYLIRAILTNSEKKTISLAKELEALIFYIDLETLRFTHAFSYQIQVDKNVDQSFVRVPPLILQPFVENAIWHGLLPKKDKNNRLTINIYRKEDFIICEIEDNGVGRKQAKNNPTKSANHQSMGIGITKKRIQLLHPDNDIYIIDLVDEKNKALGTKVMVQLYAPD